MDGVTDQAKRWTAVGSGINCAGIEVARTEVPTRAEEHAVAARLAACADLLRGAGDLEGVAVMTWADVEKVRALLKDGEEYAIIDGRPRVAQLYRDTLATVPVPPKGD